MTKEWIVVHKIRSLFDGGSGLSIRAISNELGVSRNTVRKYLRMNDSEIFASRRSDRVSPSRDRLSFLQPYLMHMLSQFPNIQAAKLAKKILAKFPNLSVSERTLRRHIRVIKETGQAEKSLRGEPLIDMVPGVQCQVHMGVVPDVIVSSKPCRVHVLGFALSFSKLVALDVRLAPYTIQAFVNGHDAAFGYFGGIPEECAYDRLGQRHVGSLFESYDSSQKLYQYAAGIGVRLRIIDGYQMAAHEKVEPLIDYVEQSAFGGRVFSDEDELKLHIQKWVDITANQRMHLATGRIPLMHFQDEERDFLRPLQQPVLPVYSALG